jgi:AcrR family transcriptional regulator
MPQLMDTRNRAGTLVAAVNEILATDGIPGLSLRKVAHVSRVSTGSIIHHLGDKARLLSLGAGLTAQALHHRISLQTWEIGALAFLPGSGDEIVDLRVWLAWVELGRSDPGIELYVTRAEQEERALLAETLGYVLSRDDLDLVAAVIDGLRTRVCAPSRPMSPRKARELLSTLLKTLGASTAVRPDLPWITNDATAP